MPFSRGRQLTLKTSKTFRTLVWHVNKRMYLEGTLSHPLTLSLRHYVYEFMGEICNSGSKFNEGQLGEPFTVIVRDTLTLKPLKDT